MELHFQAMNLQEYFNRFIEKYKLDTSGIYLVGISGGLDSMVLLHLCVLAELNIIVAHVNYELRGNESDADEEFVISACRQMQLRTEILKAGKMMNASLNSGSTQMKARTLRMDFFDTLLQKYDAKNVFLANHADDQAEGFFLAIRNNFSLQGMSENDGKKLRPFLSLEKSELANYAQQNNITWREDSSNLKQDYLRNKIRIELLPAILSIDPRFKQDLLKSIKREFSEKQALDILFEVHFKAHTSPVHQGFQVKKEAFQIFPEPLPALAYLLAPFSVSGKFLAEIARNLTNTAPIRFYCNGASVLLDRCYLSVYQNLTPDQNTQSADPPVIIQEEVSSNETNSLIFNKNEAILNPEGLSSGLYLRKWQKGDKFYPSGMKGSKLLSDFFNDLKLSSEEKSNQWLLCSGEEIVWVVNQRVDERFRFKPGNHSAIRVRIS